MCLSCGATLCSRFVNCHMEDHWLSTIHEESSRHCIALSLSDLSCWCYECNSYIKHEKLTPLLVRAESIKFAVEEKGFLLDNIVKDFTVGIICPRGETERHVSESFQLERPERLSCVYDRLHESILLSKLRSFPPMEGRLEDVALAHSAEYISDLMRTALQGTEEGDQAIRNLVAVGDVYANKFTASAAVAAVGSVVDLTERVLRGEIQRGFALVRPPGHHACHDRTGGFCLLNNVAVAARVAQKRYSVAKIAIVDFDIHHGNGTQDIFYNDPTVLHISIHRQQFGEIDGEMWEFSDEGKEDRIGEGAGLGFNINVPLPAGDQRSDTAKDGKEKKGLGDADYLYVWDRVVLPLLSEFKPDLILVPAGFDASEGDCHMVTGGYHLSPAAYTHMTAAILRAVPGGKCVMSLEGGYSPRGLADSAEACVRALLDYEKDVDALRRAASSGGGDLNNSHSKGDDCCLKGESVGVGEGLLLILPTV